MKNFTNPSFFRLFDLLMSTHNPGFGRSKWTLDGVDCGRERHSFTGQQYGYSVEIFTFSHVGKRGGFCLPASPPRRSNERLSQNGVRTWRLAQ
jgi:hypothetical protein